jgi:hypothetical protein
MTYTLLERLRTMGNSGWHPIGNEAADEIEKLQLENASLKYDYEMLFFELVRLREALSYYTMGGSNYTKMAKEALREPTSITTTSSS